MTKTREQKEQSIAEFKDMLQGSKGFMVIGFTGVSVEDINDFRGNLLDVGGRLRVAKKRLLNIVLENQKIDFDLGEFLGQTGLVPFDTSLPEVASTVFDFADDREVKIIGGYDLEEGALVEAEYLERLGNLPSREVLLGQVVGAISAPIRALMYALKQRAEKVE